MFLKKIFRTRRLAVLLVVLLCSTHWTFSQDPLRFIREVDSLKNLSVDHSTGKKIVLFTGSSSIRMWRDVQDYFPDVVTVNTGFGGSQMSDLSYFLDELVLQYKPDQVFIYEGDNDVADGKRPGEIIKDYENVIARIHGSLPGVTIALITPKPSLARWELRKQYGKVNRRIEKLAQKDGEVFFVDVWPVMLGRDGKPIGELFLDDGLHMKPRGYQLWAGEIRKYLR